MNLSLLLQTYDTVQLCHRREQIESPALVKLPSWTETLVKLKKQQKTTNKTKQKPHNTSVKKCDGKNRSEEQELSRKERRESDSHPKHTGTGMGGGMGGEEPWQNSAR